jgi:adenosylcobyric acid synthase
VVIEGAGSPAEINLYASDIVNMRAARQANARCLLVSDIDRGGAFAHLYGTWALLPPEDRARIAGFVLNRFRGDAALLAPGPARLQELTGVATVATLPMWWQHGLPEEDGVFDERSHGRGPVRTTIAVIAYPRISNLDEFQPLKNVPGVRLVWARSPADCDRADWLVLPGSKHTSADLAWLKAQGLDRTVQAHAAAGRPVLGICGGLQMLGQALVDPHGIDGSASGLGLLPLVSRFERVKTVRRSHARFGELDRAWRSLSGVPVSGYEIHHGITGPAQPGGSSREVLPALGWQDAGGNVLGVYLHGLFEDPAVLQALFGASVPTLERVFDGLADFVGKHFEDGVLARLLVP